MATYITSPFDDLIVGFSDFKNCAVKIDKKDFSDTSQFIRDFRVLYLLMQNRLFSNVLPNGHLTPSFVQITFSDFCIETRVKYYSFISHINSFARFAEARLSSIKPPPLANRVYFYRNKVVEHWDDYVTRFNDGSQAAKGKIPIPTLSWSFSPPEMQEQRRTELVAAFEKQGVSIDIPQDTFFDKLGSIVYPKMEEVDPTFKDRRKWEEISECLWRYNFPLPFYDCENYATELTLYFQSFLNA